MKYSSSSAGITDISQTGVEWQELQTSPISGASGARTKVLILAGIVGSGASSTITITLSGTITAAVADVNEYSGLSTDYLENYGTGSEIYAQNSNSASSNLNTNPTATTRYPNELWIGGTIARSTQTTPLNSFTLEDGAFYNSAISVGYLYKIVTSTGIAQTGTTSASAGPWSAVLVTLPAAASMTLKPSHGVRGSDTVIECNGTGVAADTTINAKWNGADITFTGEHTSDHGGSFLVNITLPPTAAAGSHSVIVTDGATSAHATFTVSDPVSVLPESDLGISSLLIAIALAMVVWMGITKRAKKK